MWRNELPHGETRNGGPAAADRPVLLRALSLIFGVLATVFLFAPAASADEAYPPGPAVIGVSDATSCPGDQFTFYGGGYAFGGETVRIACELVPDGQGLRASYLKADVPGVPTSVQADANGSFSIVLIMPDTTLKLTATGATSGLSQTVSVTKCGGPTTVTPTTDIAAPGGPLPNTGAGFDVTSAVVLGLGAVLIGLILAYIGTRDMYRTRRTRRLAH